MFSNGDKTVVKRLLGVEEFQSHGLGLDNKEHQEELTQRKKNAEGKIIGRVPHFESYYRLRQGAKTIAIYHIGELELKHK